MAIRRLPTLLLTAVCPTSHLGRTQPGPISVALVCLNSHRLVVKLTLVRKPSGIYANLVLEQPAIHTSLTPNMVIKTLVTSVSTSPPSRPYRSDIAERFTQTIPYNPILSTQSRLFLYHTAIVGLPIFRL